MEVTWRLGQRLRQAPAQNLRVCVLVGVLCSLGQRLHRQALAPCLQGCMLVDPVHVQCQCLRVGLGVVGWGPRA